LAAGIARLQPGDRESGRHIALIHVIKGEVIMKRFYAAALGLLLAFASGNARADLATDWNQTTRDVLKAARVIGGPGARTLAMVHVAMSDAINCVQDRYARYITTVGLMPNASAEAAAATAARDILVQLYPAQKQMIEDAYAASIKTIPEGQAKTEGFALGEKIAAAVQADRATDGTSAPDTYRPHTTPGVWVPTALPITAQYARARPWVLNSADQFRPGPPPQLSSALYARDYNETKAMGSAKSTTRTAEQTEAVKFWVLPNLAASWQQAATQLSAVKGLSLAETARLFALLNMGYANTFIMDWDAKFTYNFWRPITAIRNGDNDGNDATERDAGWLPLNDTPNHPEYPSQASIIAGMALVIFESVFGPKPAIPYTVTDFNNSNLKRPFTGIAQMAEEHANVRVWGGIHFRNSLEVADGMGKKIATYLIDNALKPRR